MSQCECVLGGEIYGLARRVEAKNRVFRVGIFFIPGSITILITLLFVKQMQIVLKYAANATGNLDCYMINTVERFMHLTHCY